MIPEDKIKKQSEAAYRQWCKDWRKNATVHSKFEMKPLSDYENSGVGRAILLVANGYSFERELDVIKKYQDNVDILVCDKTLGHCLDHGIKPTYALLCDANVSYESYLEKWKDQLSDITLFSNVCGNTDWTKQNWKDVYFFVNQDVLKSEKEFSKLSGCKNFIPAGTNVSNAMAVFVTQSTNNARRNFFGYDKIILIGFDYSWREETNYYAFDNEAGGKKNYMNHLYCIDNQGEFAYSSGNLLFSSQWLRDYDKAFRLPLVNCSKSTILNIKNNGNLEDHIQYKYKTEDCHTVKSLMTNRQVLMDKLKKIETAIHDMGKDHYLSYVRSL